MSATCVTPAASVQVSVPRVERKPRKASTPVAYRKVMVTRVMKTRPCVVAQLTSADCSSGG